MVESEGVWRGLSALKSAQKDAELDLFNVWRTDNVQAAVILVLSIVLRLLGVDSILDERNAGINYEALLILSLVIGFGGSFISLAMSKWMAKRTTGARVITRPANAAESWLTSTVDRQARQAGIETPEVAIYDSPDMNAFATGARRNAALVAVSTGLLRSMPKEEIEAVLAHEISHVANGDMVTLGHPDADSGCGEYVRHLPLSRHWPLRRSRYSEKRQRPRDRVLCCRHCGSTVAWHTRKHDRHVGVASA
jgi:hypothetical protein